MPSEAGFGCHVSVTSFASGPEDGGETRRRGRRRRVRKRERARARCEERIGGVRRGDRPAGRARIGQREAGRSVVGERHLGEHSCSFLKRHHSCRRAAGMSQDQGREQDRSRRLRAGRARSRSSMSPIGESSARAWPSSRWVVRRRDEVRAGRQTWTSRSSRRHSRSARGRARWTSIRRPDPDSARHGRSTVPVVPPASAGRERQRLAGRRRADIGARRVDRERRPAGAADREERAAVQREHGAVGTHDRSGRTARETPA